MDLWIRSQDKLTLTKINSIGIEYDKKLVGYGKICVKLGEYKTKERALEVLDEIQRIIEPRIKFQEISTSGELDNGLSDAVLHTYTYPVVNELGTYVYEMPKE